VAFFAALVFRQANRNDPFVYQPGSPAGAAGNQQISAALGPGISHLPPLGGKQSPIPRCKKKPAGQVPGYAIYYGRGVFAL